MTIASATNKLAEGYGLGNWQQRGAFLAPNRRKEAYVWKVYVVNDGGGKLVYEGREQTVVMRLIDALVMAGTRFEIYFLSSSLRGGK